MDIIDLDAATNVGLCGGAPQELLDRIWSKKSDNDFVDSYIRYKQNQEASKNGI